MTGLGFACISKSLKENGRFRTMSVKTYNNLKPDERMRRLRAITVDNLYNTYRIILWCIENSISLYRLSSGLIPLAGCVPEWKWWEDRDIRNMCEKIKKIVDETADTRRFWIAVDIKKKIAIENDDKVFNAEDVLYLCEHLGVPMVLDIHHHKCNHEKDNLPQLMDRIKSTWNGKRPKVHLSSGKTCPTDRHHADYIDFEDYRQTAELVKDEFDIMMECKEKDLAVLKIMNKASSELS